MFWGLILESNKKYTQTIETSFHISMASLDMTGKPSKSPQGAQECEKIQVTVFYDNVNYLLCTLNKDSFPQQPLDLNFVAGTKVSFSCTGQNARVHLSGYVIQDDEDDEENELFDGSMNDLSDDDNIPELVPMDKKRKAGKQEKNDKQPDKKLKMLNDVSLNSESDSDDDDFEMDANSDDEDVDDDDEDVDDNEEASSEVSDDDENDEDDDDEEEEEDDDDDEKEQIKAKKGGKNQVVTNGKEAKPIKEGKQKKNKDKMNDTSNKSEQQQQQLQHQKKKVLEGGVQIEEIRFGNGAPAKPGKFVGVYYIGKLKNGKKFDSAMSGDGFKFRLGKGEVIKGWDVGILGMKVGGKRKITIPPNMAYGSKGSPPVIPPNSPLIFEVELKNVS